MRGLYQQYKKMLQCFLQHFSISFKFLHVAIAVRLAAIDRNSLPADIGGISA